MLFGRRTAEEANSLSDHFARNRDHRDTPGDGNPRSLSDVLGALLARIAVGLQVVTELGTGDQRETDDAAGGVDGEDRLDDSGGEGHAAVSVTVAGGSQRSHRIK